MEKISYYNFGEMFGHTHKVIDVSYWLSMEGNLFETSKDVIENLYKRVRKIKNRQVERLIDLSFWFTYRCMDYIKFYKEEQDPHKKNLYYQFAGMYESLRLDIMEYSYDHLSDEDCRYYYECTD